MLVSLNHILLLKYMYNMCIYPTIYHHHRILLLLQLIHNAYTDLDVPRSSTSNAFLFI
jgi:hypothetical protein